MLRDSNVMAMIAVNDLAESRKFYEDTLGLNRVDGNEAGDLYVCGGGKVFVYQSPTAGKNEATSATWNVADIHAAVDELKQKGISFEHYDFPGATYEGAVHVMFGEKAAWFKDPDGNILALAVGHDA